jgi:hypothetical protein
MISSFRAHRSMSIFWLPDPKRVMARFCFVDPEYAVIYRLVTTWPGYQGFPAQVLLKAAMGRLNFFFASISMSKAKSSGMRGSNVSQLKSKVCTCVTPAASAAYTMTRCAAATAVSTIR